MDPAGSPCRIKCGRKRRNDCKANSHENDRPVHGDQPGNEVEPTVQPANALQTQPGHADSEYATRGTDHSGFDDVLGKHGFARRAERTPQTDVSAAPRDLGEQQADRVEQTDNQEHDSDTKQHIDVLGHDFLVFHPFHDVVEPVVQRPWEAAERFLRFNIAVEEVEVGLLLGLAMQLDPELRPDALGCQTSFPTTFGRLPTARVASTAHLVGNARAERNKDVFDFLERAVIDIVEFR